MMLLLVLKLLMILIDLKLLAPVPVISQPKALFQFQLGPVPILIPLCYFSLEKRGSINVRYLARRDCDCDFE